MRGRATITFGPNKESLMHSAVFNWLRKHYSASCLLSFINPAAASHSSVAAK